MPHELSGIAGDPLRCGLLVYSICYTAISQRGMGMAAESPDVVRCGADPEEERKSLPPAIVPATGSGAVRVFTGK